MKIEVYTKSRGIKTLRDDITLSQYKQKFPDAIEVIIPSIEELQEWMDDSGCEAIDGCWVEPDGCCQHGFDSWLLALGYI